MIQVQVTTQPDHMQASIDGSSVEQLNELLTIVSWRPGLSMTVHPSGYGCSWSSQGVALREACIDYLLHVPNTYHPERELELHMHQQIPMYVRTVEDFYDFCHAIALWFDGHEGREWFKVNGRPWRDPHAPGAQASEFNARREFDRAKALRPKDTTIHFV